MKEDMKKNTAIELGLELCATNMGTYWTAGCGYLAYLVWDAGNDIYRIAFYPQGPEASTSGVTAMEKSLANAMKTMLGINPTVHLVAPKSIVRSEGKAVRVIDKRKLI